MWPDVLILQFLLHSREVTSFYKHKFLHRVILVFTFYLISSFKFTYAIELTKVVPIKCQQFQPINLKIHSFSSKLFVFSKIVDLLVIWHSWRRDFFNTCLILIFFQKRLEFGLLKNIQKLKLVKNSLHS